MSINQLENTQKNQRMEKKGGEEEEEEEDGKSQNYNSANIALPLERICETPQRAGERKVKRKLKGFFISNLCFFHLENRNEIDGDRSRDG
ncbi:hypothetical protein RUM44_006071 [Polyplax serrata]|uniref:Uncharacterized protein n=1 Tax=Polyplax serrata TaxID=468196 RepID=A0ABR1AZ02_POLSC